MIIKYELADRRVVDVEVTPEVAEAIEEFDRIEASWNRKARRRRVLSIEALSAESAWEPASAIINVEDDYIETEQRSELAVAIEALPAEQRELINSVFFLGISVRAIAEQKALCFQSVYKRLNKTITGLREYFYLTS